MPAPKILAAASFLISGTAGAALPMTGANPAILHGPHATAASILKTELAFEARAVSAGGPTAFAEYMDPVDGLEFGGGAPLRGAGAIAADMRKSGAGHNLSWVPQEVFASTGDMGVVWGNWSLSVKPGAKPITGRYVTVWRRNKAGDWKGLIDIGTADP